MLAKLKTWLWPVLGVFTGCACGWAWRSAGQDSSLAQALPRSAQPASLAEAKPTPPVQPAAAKPKSKPRPQRAPATAARCEAELRKALAGNDFNLIYNWADALAKRDAVLALRIVSDSGSKSRQSILSNIIRVAASADPNGVVQLFRDTPSLRSDLSHVGLLFDGIASRSPEQALAIFANETDHWPIEALKGIASGWVGKDWRAASNYALTLSDGTQRTTFIEAVAQPTMEQHFGDFLAWLGSLSPAVRSSLNVPWQFAHPKTLDEASALFAIAPPSFATDARGQIERSLGDIIDATPAVEAWLRKLPPGPASDLAWPLYIIKLAQSEPEKLPSLVANIQDSAASTRLTSTLAGLRALDDPQAAMAFAAALPEPRARQCARGTAMEVIAKYQPTVALSIIMATESEWYSDYLGTLGGKLADHAADAVADAALRMKSPARLSWIESATDQWLSADPLRVAEHIQHIPVGELRDSAIKAVVYATMRDSPATAMSWALSMSTPKAIDDGPASSVGRSWATESPDEYRAWLAKANLPAELRKTLETSLANGERSSNWHSSSSNGITIFTGN